MNQGNEHSIKTTKFKVTKSLNLKKKIVNFLFWEKYGLTLHPMAYENLGGVGAPPPDTNTGVISDPI